MVMIKGFWNYRNYPMGNVLICQLKILVPRNVRVQVNCTPMRKNSYHCPANTKCKFFD